MNCNMLGCYSEAEFAVKIGTVVGRYCGTDLLGYLRSGNGDFPIEVFEADASDKEVLYLE